MIRVPSLFIKRGSNLMNLLARDLLLFRIMSYHFLTEDLSVLA